MTKITLKQIVSKQELDHVRYDVDNLMELKMGKDLGREIVNMFPVYGRPYRDGLEYELSIFVFSEEEIRKIVGLLPSSDTARSINAIYEILNKNRDESTLPNQ